jgi:hypothetical protein
MKKTDDRLPVSVEDEEGDGADSGGQSGDTQGLSRIPQAGPESVEELAEEGNALEAGLVDGIENAPDADVSEVYTHEVAEDDVPLEYRQQTREND